MNKRVVIGKYMLSGLFSKEEETEKIKEKIKKGELIEVSVGTYLSTRGIKACVDLGSLEEGTPVLGVQNTLTNQIENVYFNAVYFFKLDDKGDLINFKSADRITVKSKIEQTDIAIQGGIRKLKVINL